jgi:hypothetical protein
MWPTLACSAMAMSWHAWYVRAKCVIYDPWSNRFAGSLKLFLHIRRDRRYQRAASNQSCSSGKMSLTKISRHDAKE